MRAERRAPLLRCPRSFSITALADLFSIEVGQLELEGARELVACAVVPEQGGLHVTAAQLVSD